MERIRRALVAATALLAASCANRPPSFVFPQEPQVELSADPTAMRVNWDLGMPVVEAYIDGRGPWNFLLASGSIFYALDRRVADELKLERVELSSDGVEVGDDDRKAFVRQAARIREFRVGPLVERDTGAIVRDMSLFERMTGTRIDGWLPATAFKDGLLTIDFVDQTVTVVAGELPPADGEDVLDLTWWALPCIEAEIGGNSCRICIDSGQQGGLYVPADLEASLPFRSRPVAAGGSGSLAGIAPERMGRLDGTIALGRHRIVDPVVAFIETEYAIAGVGVLHEFRVTFDFANERVRLERAGDEPIRSRSVYGLGAAFVPREGAWTVTWVLKGGPAAQVGIRVGDRVEAVDGKDVADITADALRKRLNRTDAVRMRVVGENGRREVTVNVATFVE